MTLLDSHCEQQKKSLGIEQHKLIVTGTSNYDGCLFLEMEIIFSCKDDNSLFDADLNIRHCFIDNWVVNDV
jgi:hypothetical protein